VREVELLRRPFKSVLRVCWDNSEIEIAGPVDALKGLRQQLRRG
jgi:hypothetical protein